MLVFSGRACVNRSWKLVLEDKFNVFYRVIILIKESILIIIKSSFPDDNIITVMGRDASTRIRITVMQIRIKRDVLTRRFNRMEPLRSNGFTEFRNYLMDKTVYTLI